MPTLTRHIAYGLLLLLLACTKPYAPPVINTDQNLLVVDGFINAGAGTVTQIALSRTSKLSDTILQKPENDALIEIVEQNNGVRYILQEQQGGIYVSPPLSLNVSKNYRLQIKTTNNQQYASEWVTIKNTPPIDSLTWSQTSDVLISINTHDPQNNIRYYKWDFIETWEYQSFYGSYLEYKNGQVVFRDSADYQKVCWRTLPSASIILGSSINLSDDVIYQAPITRIPNGSDKIGFKYSIMVKQLGLSQEAFSYWQTLKKNTEQQGSLFDALPSQLKGNIYNTANASEPVIGFVSAATVSEKRIFITNRELTDWQQTQPGTLCDPEIIFPPQLATYLSSGINAPAYFVTGGGIAIAKKECVDCTVWGGTNKKPLFWQ